MDFELSCLYQATRVGSGYLHGRATLVHVSAFEPANNKSPFDYECSNQTWLTCKRLCDGRRWARQPSNTPLRSVAALSLSGLSTTKASSKENMKKRTFSYLLPAFFQTRSLDSSVPHARMQVRCIFPPLIIRCYFLHSHPQSNNTYRKVIGRIRKRFKNLSWGCSLKCFIYIIWELCLNFYNILRHCYCLINLYIININALSNLMLQKILLSKSKISNGGALCGMWW